MLGQTVGPQISEYNCHLRVLKTQEVEVTTQVQIHGAEPLETLTATLVHYEGQPIQDLKLNDEKNRSVPYNLATQLRTVTLRFPRAKLADASGAGIIYTIIYRIGFSPGKYFHIPLPVPEEKTPLGARPVKIDIAIPVGWGATGDEFPSFQWTPEQKAEAVLPAVPAFVLIRVQTTRAHAWLDQMITPGHLIDAAIITLVLLGTLLWKRRYGSSHPG